MDVQKLYQQTTKRIIAELEAGTPPWTRPWKDSHVPGIGMIPSNLATGRIYSGGNILLLWLTAIDRGYDSMQFCTFKQAGEMKASVRKGEKGTPILYASRVHKNDETSGKDRTYTVAKCYTVFNVAQLNAVPERHLQTQQPLDLETPQNKARDLVNGAGVDLRFGYNEACYIPSEDYIRMPAFGMFDDEAAFTGTLMHEVTHWTGHKTRLDRDFGKRFKSQERAAEELVAEIGSAYICGRLGYQPSFRSAASSILGLPCSTTITARSSQRQVLLGKQQTGCGKKLLLNFRTNLQNLVCLNSDNYATSFEVALLLIFLRPAT